MSLPMLVVVLNCCVTEQNVTPWRSKCSMMRPKSRRLRESLSYYSDPSLPSGVTVSIGLTEAAESDDLDRLLQRADSAMYDAKDQGRNRVAIREFES